MALANKSNKFALLSREGENPKEEHKCHGCNIYCETYLVHHYSGYQASHFINDVYIYEGIRYCVPCGLKKGVFRRRDINCTTCGLKYDERIFDSPGVCNRGCMGFYRRLEFRTPDNYPPRLMKKKKYLQKKCI